MDVQRKLEILADAAKYDASCASSGTEKRDSSDGKGLGSTAPGMGICHSYAPDGRCISLLKVLLTNACNYDCLYCVNRTSSNVPRARFTVDEVVKLTIDFYRRNYIEGLFLSSGIIRSADYTMEQVVSVARKLREEHHFRGYIHLKTIPEADDALIAEAGKYADRLSINIEMPLENSLAKFAPEKDVRAIRRTMGRLRLKLDEAQENNQSRHEGKAAALCACRPEHADDHRRGCGQRQNHPRHQRQSLRLLPAQARLLFGLQPDPGRQPRAAAWSRRRSFASTGSIRPTG